MKTPASETNKTFPSKIQKDLFGSYLQDWFMTDAERCMLIALLENIRPECAIEVGTYKGGSLSVLSRFSKKVYTLDIDPACREQFESRFSNVEFITGSSHDTLPALFYQLEKRNEAFEFILIDGDHSRDGVKRDINNILKYKPGKPLYIVLHDSFNPGCRQGMIEAEWAVSPYVHSVELDFVPGTFSATPDCYKQMWCGFALSIMLPEPRSTELIIHAKEDLLFRTAFEKSTHRSKDYEGLHPQSALSKIRKELRSLFCKVLK